MVTVIRQGTNSVSREQRGHEREQAGMVSIEGIVSGGVSQGIDYEGVSQGIDYEGVSQGIDYVGVDSQGMDCEGMEVW